MIALVLDIPCAELEFDYAGMHHSGWVTGVRHRGRDVMPLVLERIASRGRSYEQAIQITYLEQLQQRYLDHLQKLDGSRVLIVDLGEHDLLHDQVAYHRLLEHIDAPVQEGVRQVLL